MQIRLNIALAKTNITQYPQKWYQVEALLALNAFMQTIIRITHECRTQRSFHVRVEKNAELYHRNEKGEGHENAQAYSTCHVAPNGMISMSVQCTVCAIRKLSIYRSAILWAGSKVKEWMRLTWVHVLYHLKGQGS